MNKEIAEKISKIKKGHIPEGYRRTRLGVLPQSWNDVLFGTVFSETIEYTNDLEQTPLYSLTIEDGVTPKTERYERSFLVKKEENNYKVVRESEFVYNPMNLRFGALAKYKGKTNVAVSGYYNVFKVNNDFNDTFMEYYLKSEYMMYLYNSIATGSLKEKQRVHFSQFIELNLPMPTIPEQNRIASILSIWDKTIKLKEVLLEQKQKQKKGLMERLLTGKVRLKGFNDDWKNVLLGRILEFPKKESLPNPQDYNLLTVKLHVKGIEATDKKPNATEKSRPYYLREPNEILIGRQNFHNGGIGIVPENMKGYIASNAISSLRVLSGDLRFYFYYLSNSSFYKKIDSIVGGTGQKEISENTMKKLKITIPKTIEEQVAISSVLTTADKEIDLLEKELESLKQQKKGLMQLLITGIVRVECD